MFKVIEVKDNQEGAEVVLTFQLHPKADQVEDRQQLHSRAAACAYVRSSFLSYYCKQIERVYSNSLHYYRNGKPTAYRTQQFAIVRNYLLAVATSRIAYPDALRLYGSIQKSLFVCLPFAGGNTERPRAKLQNNIDQIQRFADAFYQEYTTNGNDQMKQFTRHKIFV